MSDIRKVGALLIRDGRMLLISASADPTVYSMPGGPKPPPNSRTTPEQALAEHLAAELGVTLTSAEPHVRTEVVSGIDGATVQSNIYRAEIDGEPRAVQSGRRIVWADATTDVKVSTTVREVMADAAARGLVRGGA